MKMARDFTPCEDPLHKHMGFHSCSVPEPIYRGKRYRVLRERSGDRSYAVWGPDLMTGKDCRQARTVLDSDAMRLVNYLDGVESGGFQSLHYPVE